MVDHTMWMIIPLPCTQALADLCWALAGLGYTPDDTWLLRLEGELEARCCNDQRQLNNNSPPADTGAAGTGRAGGMTQQATASVGSGGVGGPLNRQQLAVVLWCLEQFKWVPRSERFFEGAAAVLAAGEGH